MALPAFAFVEVFDPVLPYGLGFAAGAMAWMVAAELLPEARQNASAGRVGAAVALSFAAMLLLQAVLPR
jgi:zinc transporter ZupT